MHKFVHPLLRTPLPPGRAICQAPRMEVTALAQRCRYQTGSMVNSSARCASRSAATTASGVSARAKMKPR